MRFAIAVVLISFECLSTLQANEPIRLTADGHRKRDPMFVDRNGSELLYVVLEKPAQLRLMKLVLSDRSSTPLHPTETRSEFEPAVSADGRYLAFVQNRGNLTLALVIQDQLENVTSEVPPGGGFSGYRSPTFAPDNSRLLFSYPEDGRQQIYSVNLLGKDRQIVIDSEGVNNWPHFAPEGRRFTFSSSRDDDYEVYVADSTGSNPQRLTDSPGQDLRPRFSPDGSRIAFTSNRDGNYEIYVMKADGTNVVRVTNHPEMDDYPTWHPNGRQLMILSERNGKHDLYQIDVP